MIQVECLWKVYESVEAVRELSFSVQPGEILGLVGPNGAGKTTTMRCLCGIIQPTSGEVFVAGVPMWQDPVAAKKALAFVPAEPRFFPYLTVWEHLQMFARMYESGDQTAKAERLLEELVLQEKRNHLPSSLSRGMQQKLMIACALIHNPQVLIFDEPFTGLDPMAIRVIRRILREHADQGTSVLISSHLLAMVEDMVDGVLIIQSGRKIAHGGIHSLVASMPALRADADLEEVFMHATGGQITPPQAAETTPAKAGTKEPDVDNADDAESADDASVSDAEATTETPGAPIVAQVHPDESGRGFQVLPTGELTVEELTSPSAPIEESDIAEESDAVKENAAVDEGDPAKESDVVKEGDVAKEDKQQALAVSQEASGASVTSEGHALAAPSLPTSDEEVS